MAVLRSTIPLTMNRAQLPPPTAATGLGLSLTPMICLYLVVAVSNLLSVPVAYLLSAEDFEFLEYGVTREDVLYAYWWTIYALVALVVLYFALGIHRLVAAYQARPMTPYTET